MLVFHKQIVMGFALISLLDACAAGDDTEDGVGTSTGAAGTSTGVGTSTGSVSASATFIDVATPLAPLDDSGITGKVALEKFVNIYNLFIEFQGCAPDEQYSIGLARVKSCAEVTRETPISNFSSERFRCEKTAVYKGTIALAPDLDGRDEWTSGDGGPADVVGRAVVIRTYLPPAIVQPVACGVFAQRAK
jgi:hypothetical protein